MPQHGTNKIQAHAKRVPIVLETVGSTNVRLALVTHILGMLNARMRTAQVTIYKAMKFEVGGSGPLTAPPPAQGSFEMFVFIKHTESDLYEA